MPKKYPEDFSIDDGDPLADLAQAMSLDSKKSQSSEPSVHFPFAQKPKPPASIADEEKPTEWPPELSEYGETMDEDAPDTPARQEPPVVFSRPQEPEPAPRPDPLPPQASRPPQKPSPDLQVKQQQPTQTQPMQEMRRPPRPTPPAQPVRQKRSKARKFVFTALGLVGLVGGVVYLFQEQLLPPEPVMITADRTPVKERPEVPPLERTPGSEVFNSLAGNETAPSTNASANTDAPPPLNQGSNLPGVSTQTRAPLQPIGPKAVRTVEVRLNNGQIEIVPENGTREASPPSLPAPLEPGTARPSKPVEPATVPVAAPPQPQPQRPVVAAVQPSPPAQPSAPVSVEEVRPTLQTKPNTNNSSLEDLFGSENPPSTPTSPPAATAGLPANDTTLSTAPETSLPKNVPVPLARPFAPYTAPASPQQAVAIAPPPLQVTTQAGDYTVQVASVPNSEAEARATFARLQRAYPDVLGGYEPIIRSADLGARGVYYRIQVGPASEQDASGLCARLKAAGGDCIVQRF